MTVEQKNYTGPKSFYSLPHYLSSFLSYMCTYTYNKVPVNYFKTCLHTKFLKKKRNAVNARTGTSLFLGPHSRPSAHSHSKGIHQKYLCISRVRPHKLGESPSQWRANTAPGCTEPLPSRWRYNGATAARTRREPLSYWRRRPKWLPRPHVHYLTNQSQFLLSVKP